MASDPPTKQEARQDDPKKWFDEGVAAYQRRDFAEAGDRFQRVLQIHPRHAHSLHLLGAVTAYQGNHGRAIELIRRAIHLSPNEADFHSSLAGCFRAAGKNDLAVGAFQHSLKIAPANASASAGLGPILVEKGLTQQAIDLYQQALARSSNDAALHYFLGAAFNKAGNLEKEIESLRNAVRLHPRFIEARTNLAIALRTSGALEESSRIFESVAALKPDSAAALCDYALSLFLLGRPAESSSCFAKALQLDGTATTSIMERTFKHIDRAIADNPNDIGVINDAALLRRMMGQNKECIALFRRAIELAPTNAMVLNNLATALAEGLQFDEAVRLLTKALEADPSYPNTYNHLGNLYVAQNVHARGVDYFQRALELDPDLPGCRWNLARCLLSCGRWAEGWEEFDSRLTTPYMNLASGLPLPYWDGSPASDKTVLLTTEGGAGDAINFIRFVPSLRPRVGRFVLRCPPVLLEIFRSVPGIDEYVAIADPLPKADLQIPLQSLPRLAKARLEYIDGAVPYLFAAKPRIAYWADRLKDFKGIKVGLVWCGSVYVRDDGRSRSIGAFAPLAGIQGVDFFSLQITPNADEPPPPGLHLRNYTSELSDYAESAALIQNLDLVISVDTSTAHLAGALGRPVWILIPYGPDFRWLLNRTDTPWYPTMRLFRQKSRAGWRDSFEEIAQGLRELVQEKQGA